MEIRTEFEAWCKTDQNLDTKRARKHDGYYWPDIQFAWQVWQGARASQWLPIESAPMDGTRILIDGDTWSREDSPEVAFWDGEHWNAADICYDHDQPTHWQPLPSLAGKL